MSSRIESLQAALTDRLAAENATGGNEPQAAFDVTLIITIITGIIDAISKCRGGAASGVTQVQAGGNRVERLTRQRLISEQYGTLREYRRQGGERVLRATLKTMTETPAVELLEAVEEHKGDMVDSGVDHSF